MHPKAMFRTLALGLSLLFGAAAADAQAVKWVVKPEASPVTFLATGKPGFLKINGEGAKLEGTGHVEGGKLTGAFDVNVDAFKTGIDLRDEHMKNKYLETGKFPKAHLVLEAVAIDPASTSEQEKDFTGKLTIKGVEKPVSGKMTVTFSGKQVKGEATFPVQIDEYPIEVPVYLGVTVAKSVDVKVEFVGEQG
jgi:polyisoprenoid-binding protein YceI